jgi:hypothetical protein
MKNNREEYRFAVKYQRDRFAHQMCLDFGQYNQYREGVLALVEYIDWLEHTFQLKEIKP